MNYVQAHRVAVGIKVKKARKSAGLSLDRLAATVGTSRRHLVRIEKGDHLPREGLLSRIAEATDTDLAFFESSDDEEPDPVALLEALMSRVAEQAAAKAIANHHHADTGALA